MGQFYAELREIGVPVEFLDVRGGLSEVPEELGPLTGILAETCFCNFSIFQSLPDSWAIDQLFPVMPVHRLDEEGGWWVEELVRGDRCSDVLDYVHYDPERLYPRLERDCERAVREGELTVAERRSLLEFYESALGGYTYLEPGVS